MTDPILLKFACAFFALLAISCSFNFVIIYYVLIIILSIVFGVFIAVKVKKKNLNNEINFCDQQLFNEVLTTNHIEDHLNEDYFKVRTLISKNIDEIIEEIVECCLRDFIFVWYQTLIGSENKFLRLRLKNDIWLMLEKFLTRLEPIDEVKFITANLINRLQKHLQKINLSWSQEQPTCYSLSSHLASSETEIEFLRKLSDLLLHILFPKEYIESDSLIHLLREIFAVQILFKTIDFICDPDYINQKILEYLKWMTEENERRKRAYAYAETFEDFIKMINRCNDIEDLKRIKYYIVTEIMQATVINNFKRERGIDQDKGLFSGPLTSTKGDQLQARNLIRYINQLRFAKSQCEKRIIVMGGSEVDTSVLASSTSKGLLFPNKKTVLAFRIIMSSDLCRTHLKKFLQNSVSNSSVSPESRKYLIVFWEMVEQMRKQESSFQYKIANQILGHPQFVISVNNHIKLPKMTLRAMEEFVLGNRGPDAFFNAQTFVYDILEHRYYPLFIVSKEYDEMLNQVESLENLKCEFQTETNSQGSSSESLVSEDCDKTMADDFSSNDAFDGHVVQTKRKIQVAKQKLKDKLNAMEALRKSEHDNGKSLSQNQNISNKLFQMLNSEVEEISIKLMKLESHLEWTLQWVQNIGFWCAEIHRMEFDSKDNLYFVIIVRNGSEDSLNDGWVITRTQEHVINFRNKLIKEYKSIAKIEFPKFRLKSQFINQHLEVIQRQLQIFFDAICFHEAISKSEDLYFFFSQSDETLRQPLIDESKSKSIKFPFASLFGISNPKQSSESANIDNELIDKEFLILDDSELKPNSKDDIAEPLYNLICEIFELRGVFNLLRRTLITFVQITYGQNINKHIRETVNWIFSETMLQYYFETFKNSMWPNGVLAEPTPERSENQKKQTQALAKQYTLSCIPEFAINFFGHQNAKKGVSKVFDSLQDKNLNKQLCYEFIETFVFELAPELKNIN